MAGTLAALWFQATLENRGGGLGPMLSAGMKREIGSISSGSSYLRSGMKGAGRGALFFQIWMQRAGLALVLWLAGMTPLALPAAWGFCWISGMEAACLMAGFTGWDGIWGLPVFAVTLFPQGLFYIPVFLMLLSWSFSRKRRVRGAGCLILMFVLGLGAALEVWVNPLLLSFFISRGLC